MVKVITIGKFDFTFVFRHKWDKESKRSHGREFRPYSLGIFFSKTLCVKESTPKDGTISERFSRFAPSIMIGLNLIICKAWITIDKGVMKLGEDK